MPRKKRETVEPIQPLKSDDAAREPSDQPVPTGTAASLKLRARSFKANFSVAAKGVTLGERNGHDWVITFPADPGKGIRDRLSIAGFEYRDRKWKVFTHAANRPQVESLARALKRELGDEITVNDYPTRQVVLAFDAPPGEKVTARLKDADFHFRSDFTWNADYSAESQRFARDLIKSLPDRGRSAAAGR
jgi:hypothetical protein